MDTEKGIRYPDGFHSLFYQKICEGEGNSDMLFDYTKAALDYHRRTADFLTELGFGQSDPVVKLHRGAGNFFDILVRQAKRREEFCYLQASYCYNAANDMRIKGVDEKHSWDCYGYVESWINLARSIGC